MVTSFKKTKARHSILAKMYSKIASPKTSIKGLVIYVGILSTLIMAIAAVGIYFFYLHSLPQIESIESDTLPESTIIYDRNGGELYNLYSKEKRTYIGFDQISSMIREAIVATEDKTFFENAGVDMKGLLRSGVNFVTGRTERLEGTSTISQQLIKNTFLSNERSFERKFKEIYLSYRLNSKYSKEKILELYLNKISFGNNAFGVEEASKTYFGKSAKDVGVLGATILASIPKGPTYYSPYSHRDRLMGYLYVYDEGSSEEDRITLDSPEKMKEYKALVDTFKNIVTSMKIEKYGDGVTICGLKKEEFKAGITVDDEGCVDIGYKDMLTFFNSIRIESERNATVSSGSGTKVETEKRKVYLEYNTGRKDFVATRMFEDGKITIEQLKDVVVGGLDFQFRKYAENIKYPYFVFYVKEFLENKYGKDFEAQGGLRIYTTIDPKLQDKAEELVKKQVKVNISKYGASSAALVSMDNKNGQILSMVGWPDYFDQDNGGNVNMITSKRQPGSSFKPIVYALAMSKEAVSPDTPIYDVDTKFGNWNPDNYDQKFLGKMKVRTALDYSRNIPAIKMFSVAGGESSVVKFGRSLGILSLTESGNYGSPLAIGTGELKPLELMGAYSVFANAGWKREINPILRIEDKKGNIIEQAEADSGKYIFSEAASYLLSVILSDAKSRPGDFWNNVLTLKDRAVAAKTGTSNKDVSVGKQKKILPRDLWTAGYTPQITTVVWAGNVDGTETKGTCDGLNCAAPIWHDYMEFAHKNLPKEEFKKPESVYTATISAVSGKLASESTPDSMKVTSIFAVKPTAYESAMKEISVDSLCNGKVTDTTPPDAVIKGLLLDVNPIIESYDPKWLPSIRGWIKGDAATNYTAKGVRIIPEYKDQICERPGAAESNIAVRTNWPDNALRQVWNNPISVSFDSENPIVKISVALDGNLLKEAVVDGEQSIGNQTVVLEFDTSLIGADHTLTIKAIDKYGYSGKSSMTMRVEAGKYLPVINITSHGAGSVPKIYQDQFFNLRFDVSGQNEIVTANLSIDDKLEKILGGGNSFVAAVNEKKNLGIGLHRARIDIIDSVRQKVSKEMQFEVIAR